MKTRQMFLLVVGVLFLSSIQAFGGESREQASKIAPLLYTANVKGYELSGYCMFDDRILKSNIINIYRRELLDDETGVPDYLIKFKVAVNDKLLAPPKPDRTCPNIGVLFAESTKPIEKNQLYSVTFTAWEPFEYKVTGYCTENYLVARALAQQEGIVSAREVPEYLRDFAKSAKEAAEEYCEGTQTVIYKKDDTEIW